jgi:hypothetical protein
MSLEKSLKIASHLARSDNAIRKLRDNQPLETGEKEWVLNLFNMDTSTEYKEDRGRIGFILFGDDKNNAAFLFDFSKRLTSELEEADWKFILNGLLRYRRFLIDKSLKCSCGCG